MEAAAGEGVYESLGGTERREAVAVAGALPLYGERVAEEEDVQAKVPVAIAMIMGRCICMGRW